MEKTRYRINVDGNLVETLERIDRIMSEPGAGLFQEEGRLVFRRGPFYQICNARTLEQLLAERIDFVKTDQRSALEKPCRAPSQILRCYLKKLRGWNVPEATYPI